MNRVLSVLFTTAVVIAVCSLSTSWSGCRQTLKFY